MGKMRTTAAWIALGASVMYVLDPARGRVRRATLRDQTLGRVRRLARVVAGIGYDVGNRVRGRLVDLRARFGQETVDDAILVERVRAAMGHAVRHPHDIEVVADHGRIALRGQIDPERLDPLLHTVRSVRGVSEIDNQMTLAETAISPAA